MHRTLLIVSVLMLVASLVSAQPGQILLTADAAHTSCDIVDGAGLVTVYVFHINTNGASASQFMVETSAGMLMTYLAYNTPYLGIGDPRTGISIAYGACYTGPLQIMSIQYLANGLSTPCATFTIVADPTATVPGLYSASCSNPPLLLTALGSTASVNNDGSCPCPEIVPVEETSWGQIKAIYQ